MTEQKSNFSKPILIRKISENISYIEATNPVIQGTPLSADIGLIKARDFTWIYDVGNNAASLNYLSGIPNKKIVISHFHPDHMENLKDLMFDTLYVSPHTYKYLHKLPTTPDDSALYRINSCEIQIVEKDIYFDDGCNIHIFPLPSSHARGCLGLEIDETYAFLGDAIYASLCQDKKGYNVQLLRELIETLERIKAPFVLPSHKKGLIRDKKSVLYMLNKIYSGRVAGNPFIEIH